jgi:CheY-like chemotaxis protein
MSAHQRPKALVVDDEPAFRKVLAVMLGVIGWDSEVVCSWEEALRSLQAEHFDLLLTDYHIPHGNGFHFICCLRRDGITLPAIVMSGDVQVLRFAPKDILHIPIVLHKPFTISELRAALAMVSST